MLRLSDLYIIAPALRDKLLEQAKKSGGWQAMCGGAVSHPILRPDEGLGVFARARKRTLIELREAIDSELQKPEYRSLPT